MEGSNFGGALESALVGAAGFACAGGITEGRVEVAGVVIVSEEEVAGGFAVAGGTAEGVGMVEVAGVVEVKENEVAGSLKDVVGGAKVDVVAEAEKLLLNVVEDVENDEEDPKLKLEPKLKDVEDPNGVAAGGLEAAVEGNAGAAVEVEAGVEAAAVANGFAPEEGVNEN